MTSALDDIQRFYELGKQAQWNAADVPWHLPLTPQGADTPRRQAIWRSVITQQYQADLYAMQAAAHFVVMAPDPPAQLYYTVMAQDEARHVEVWSRLVNAFGGPAEFDPYLAEMGNMVIEAQELELKIIPLQVFFEGMAIGAFRELADSTPNTVLGNVCHRLAKDDAIHHGFGYAYSQVLLERASPALQHHINATMDQFWQLYKAHFLWRPQARQWISKVSAQEDKTRLGMRATFVRKMMQDLGLNFSVEE